MANRKLRKNRDYCICSLFSAIVWLEEKMIDANRYQHTDYTLYPYPSANIFDSNVRSMIAKTHFGYCIDSFAGVCVSLPARGRHVIFVLRVRRARERASLCEFINTTQLFACSRDLIK